MKTCPQCHKSFPDSERFCDADGSALTADAASTRTTAIAEPTPPAIECPVCGGKAEPGELICNFCGARLADAKASPPAGSATPGQLTQTSAGRTTFDDEPLEPASSGGSIFGRIIYIVAALVALAGGAWFAIHLSQGQPPNPALVPTPTIAATPAVAAGPIVALSEKVAVQVTGESAAAPERDQAASGKLFGDNEAGLMDLYRRSLASDATVHDGMAVRLQVMPSGEVTEGRVLISTAPNPSLDAEVVKTMMGWRYSSFGGTAVEVDYPIIFARDGAERDDIDKTLADKIAHLDPAAPPEYASELIPTPEVIPTEVAAPSPTPPSAVSDPGGVADAASPAEAETDPDSTAIVADASADPVARRSQV